MRRSLFALALVAASTLVVGTAGAEPDHPNILLIIADDVGAEMIGKYPNGNASPASTPRIDELADAGVMFTNVWSNPYCGTTRATIMTGRYAHRTGIAWAGGTLLQSEVTIPEKLASAGYKSAIIGKWGLVASLVASENSSHPIRSGFDYFSGSPSTQLETPGGPSNYFYWRKYFGTYDAQRLNCDGTHDDIDCVDTTGSPVVIGDEEPGEEQDPEEPGDYATTINVNDAIDWIDGVTTQSPQTPWFLVLAFNAAHATFHAPPFALHGMQLNYDADDRRCEGTAVPACYRAMIEAMDAEIGRLRTELTSMGEWNDTVVIFVGDNGSPGGVGVEAPGEYKGTLFEGGVNVPLIVQGPGVLGSGTSPSTARVSQALVNTSDLFTTVLDLANVDTTLAVDHDSYSLAPVLAGVTSAVRHWAYAEVGGSTAAHLLGNNSGKALRHESGLKLHRRRDGNGSLHWYLHLLPTPGTRDDPDDNLLAGGNSLVTDPSNPFLDAVIQLQLLPVFGNADLDTAAPEHPNLPPANPDPDADGVVDDNCPSVPNPGQQDADSDGVGDACDNCRTLAQDPSQRCDTDKDGYGNLCDGDFDNDGFTFPSDFDLWSVDFTTTGLDTGKRGTDMNCDESVDAADFPHWYDQAQGSAIPGPTGLLCAGKQPCVVP